MRTTFNIYGERDGEWSLIRGESSEMLAEYYISAQIQKHQTKHLAPYNSYKIEKEYSFDE